MFFGFTGLCALIPLGYVFIYGRLGLPALGAQGSGIANAIVLWLQVFAFATYVRLSPRYRPLHLFARFEKPDPRAIFGLLRIGVPMGVTLLMEAGMFSIAALLISRANRGSLNVEGAFQHILNDAWAFIATAASGLIVLLTGFNRADALASLVVAGLMARAGYGLVRESWKIFLEAAPEGVDPAEVAGGMRALDGVVQVHDLHVWTITSGFPALSAHVLVSPGHDCHGVRLELEALVRKEYGIEHTTLQVEHAASDILTIGRGALDSDRHPEGHCTSPAACPESSDQAGCHVIKGM